MAISTRIQNDTIELEVALSGDFGSVKAWAVLDTGFSGDVVCDLNRAMRLGLQPVGTGGVTLADGSVVNVPLFYGRIQLGTEVVREAIFIIIGDEILIGMNTIRDYPVSFHAKQNKATIGSVSSAAFEPPIASVSRVWSVAGSTQSPTDALRTALKAISPRVTH